MQLICQTRLLPLDTGDYTLAGGALELDRHN
jgi:hypothetical protein